MGQIKQVHEHIIGRLVKSVEERKSPGYFKSQVSDMQGRKPERGEVVKLTEAETAVSEALALYCIEDDSVVVLRLTEIAMGMFAKNHGIDIDEEKGEWAMSDDHEHLYFNDWSDYK